MSFVTEVLPPVSLEATMLTYGAIAGGALAMIGVLTGMFAERYLQERGKVRCVVSDWQLAFYEAGASGGEPVRAVCSFEVNLFNERTLPSGLRGVSVAFVQNGEEEVVGRLRSSISDEEVEVLNLPSRRWVCVSLYGYFEVEEARKLSNFERADLVGYFPDDRKFRQRIVVRKDFVASRKRFVATRKNFVAARKRFAALRKNFTLPWWRKLSG